MLVQRARLARIEDGQTGGDVLRVDELAVHDAKHFPPEPVGVESQPDLLAVHEGIEDVHVHQKTP